MATKNNPNNRDKSKLVIYCINECMDKYDKRARLVLTKKVPGGMYYICPICNKEIKSSPGIYKTLPHERIYE